MKKIVNLVLFFFITRNRDQNTATKSLSANKTAKTSLFENRSIMHCKQITRVEFFRLNLRFSSN